MNDNAESLRCRCADKTCRIHNDNYMDACSNRRENNDALCSPCADRASRKKNDVGPTFFPAEGLEGVPTIERAKHGTAWTEPGQGATVENLEIAFYALNKGFKSPLWEAFCAIEDGLTERVGFRNHTNLRLTGNPLTAEDVARIAEAK
jgi:hypothetical protein